MPELPWIGANFFSASSGGMMVKVSSVMSSGVTGGVLADEPCTGSAGMALAATFATSPIASGMADAADVTLPEAAIEWSALAPDGTAVADAGSVGGAVRLRESSPR